MTDHIVLRVVGKLMIPMILLYGLYVQAHGDFGPGGGFQAGVIFAAGFILYGLIYGVEAARKVIPAGVIEVLAALGIVIYAGVGIAALFCGGSYLGYGSFNHHDASHGHHLGVMLVEIGVGVTVASVMLIIFFVFAGRRPSSTDKA